MSRLAKKPIVIPENVTAVVLDGLVTVKGPLGELKRQFRPEIAITVSDHLLTVKPIGENLETRALSGTYVSHIKNMIAGVTTGFQKKLLIEGIGFKAEVKGQEIVFNIGFSHPVKLAIPKGLKVLSEKGQITVSGNDKEAVGAFAAQIRSEKKPEPYKGKGIRYFDEVVRRKEGKKTV